MASSRGFELWIAFRYLRIRARELFIMLITWISVGGVAIGVMALIVVISVMTGFETDLRDKILGANPHVKITSGGKRIVDYERVVEDVVELEGVKNVTPYVESKMMLSSGRRSMGVVMRGVSPGALSGVSDFDKAVRNLSLVSKESLPGIIIGAEMARNMAIMRGDEIRLFSPGGHVTPAGYIPRFRLFRVVDTFVTGMYEYDTTWVVTTLEEAKDFLRMGDTVTGIDIRLDDPGSAPRIAPVMGASLGGNLLVRDWTLLNRSLFGAMKLEKMAMFLVLGLIIIVAAFNIASTLIMVVMDKTRDIGVLKSMGASRTTISRIFVVKGAFIGLIGTTAGVVLGVGIGLLLEKGNLVRLPSDIYYVDTVPVVMEPSTIALIAISSIGVCLLATLYPAWQAARLDPVKTIRYE